MFIVINNSTQVDSNSECGTTEKSKSGTLGSQLSVLYDVLIGHKYLKCIGLY